MPAFLCTTCGTQYDESAGPPTACPICEDERQYVNWVGQQWTTIEELRRDHKMVCREEDPGLLGLGIEPKFAIGQRALLIESPGGNVLWDCISLIDDAAIECVRSR